MACEQIENKYSHWISCSEKLPELVNDIKEEYDGDVEEIDIWLESDHVLVYSDTSERIYIAVLSAYDTLEEKNWINVENLETVTNVTHWTPLPKTPNGGKSKWN